MLELLTGTTLDLAHSGARHGEGLFETLRVVRGVPLRLAAHLERLAAGAAFLGLAPPPSAAAVQAFLASATRCPELDLGVLRLVAVDGQLRVTVAPWAPDRPDRIVVGISDRIVRLARSPLNRFKTLSYLENRLLAREAEHLGVFELVALNEAGRLTDGSRTSLFLLAGGRLLTPPVADGALPGVARRVLLEAGLAREASLTPEDLFRAEAVLLVNSLQGGIPAHALVGPGNSPLEAGPILIERAVALLG